MEQVINSISKTGRKIDLPIEISLDWEGIPTNELYFQILEKVVNAYNELKKEYESLKKENNEENVKSIDDALEKINNYYRYMFNGKLNNCNSKEYSEKLQTKKAEFKEAKEFLYSLKRVK